MDQDRKNDSDSEDLNELCKALFDSFCEQRNVIALAYMMHAWPLVERNATTCRRLLQNLVELCSSHLSELSEADQILIDRIVANLMYPMVDFACVPDPC